jgi:hypothetical protein
MKPRQHLAPIAALVRRRLPSLRAGGLLAAALLSVAIASGCKTTLPKSDPTPPALTWDVYNFATSTHQTFSGNAGPVHVHPGESFRVTLTAEDSGGVHKIGLGGGGTYTCLSGEIGQNTSVDLAGQEQTLHPDAGNQVLTKIFLLQNVDLNAWTCSPGFTFSAGSLTLIGSAENYFSGKTQATLTFQRP